MSTIFYASNIFNFFRLFILILSAFLPKNFFIILYSISSSFDMLDGFIARKLNILSKLGNVLDFFTDRTATLIIILRIFQDRKLKNTKNKNLFNFIISNNFLLLCLIIDNLAHNFYFIILRNHKNFFYFDILKIYYNDTFLGFICFAKEFFYILVYLYLTNIYFKKSIFIIIILFFCMIVRKFFNLILLFDGIFRLSLR